MRLTSLGPDGVVVIPVDAGVGILLLEAAENPVSVALRWAWRPHTPLMEYHGEWDPRYGTFPPALWDLRNNAKETLARIEVPVARTKDTATPVVKRALAGGSRDLGLRAAEEAVGLFQNEPRVSSGAVEASQKNVKQIVAAYYELAEWLQKGAGSVTVVVGDYCVQGQV